MLFYTRDSGGKHETTPGEYVRTAAQRAMKEGLTFGGSPELIEGMIRSGAAESGDLYLDYDVKGNLLQRPGLDALMRRIASDMNISHVFVPRRDRLARPDHALDGAQLELKIRSLGVTLLFLDRVCEPLIPGARDQIGDLIMSVIDYDQAGKDRRVLAEKILFAQLSLAKGGFSTGGRPPYGFRRWLVKTDGTKVRELVDGERVRMADHHVVWVPVADDHPDMRTIRRILASLETMPATRLAAELTAEGIPSPDAGRTRKDNGIRHAVSGAWHAPTIVNIACNPLLQAIVAYGRRSMGDQLRFEAGGPRGLSAEDYRSDGKPKVTRNDQSSMLTAEAKFDPLVDEGRHQKLLATLRRRGGTQRGKARSRDPNRNPLGGRVVDMDCTWPMYRVPQDGSFKYKCGAYMQSHGAICKHNQVDGLTLTNVTLDVLRQQLLAPPAMEKLKARLCELATSERSVDTSTSEVAAKEEELRRIEQDQAKAERNMALADSPEQYKAVAAVFEQLRARRGDLDVEICDLRQTANRSCDVDDEVTAALTAFDRLPELVNDGGDLVAVTAAFNVVNARVFLGFEPVRLAKRTVNRVHCGKITFGSEAPPVEVYQGPTGRRALKDSTTATFAVSSGGDQTLPGPM